MEFIRKKRTSSDTSSPALILAKKPKLDNFEPITSLYKFAGSVHNKENISEIINKVSLNNPAKSTNFENIARTKRVGSNLSLSKTKRLQIVNCFRGILDDVNEKQKEVTIIDVSDTKDVEIIPDKDNKEYVYDLYYSSSNNAIADDPNFTACSVHEVNDSYLGDDCYVNDEEEESFTDEEDSNEESNWRNDYPDENEEWSDNEISILDSKFKCFNAEDSSSDDSDDITNNKFHVQYENYKAKVKDEECDYYNEVADSDPSSSSETYDYYL